MSIDSTQGIFSQFETKYALPTTFLLGTGIIFVLIRRYFQGARCLSKVMLNGKTVVITGGNSGIGKATALELAKRGAQVVLGCRDVTKCQGVVGEIKQKSGNEAIFLKMLDLSVLSSVSEFAEEVLREFPDVHILINNAGVICKKETTQDGFDKQWSVNYLGHFLLTNRLLDRMKSSSPARIINVGSKIYADRLDFEDLMQESNYEAMKAYKHSKLAVCLFTHHLSQLLRGSSVTVNTVSPGHVWTQLNRHIIRDVSLIKKCLFWCIFGLVAKSPWFGAQTVVHCCVAPEMERVSGLMFRECKVMEVKPHARDPIVAEKLWSLSRQQTT